MTFRDPLVIALGGVALIWPALANLYPLLFVDTGAFLDQLLWPFMFWDKPWIYGPVLAVVSMKYSLWVAVAAQGWTVSWILWRVAAVFGPVRPVAHLTVCLVLAAGSAASWFASLLMPDIFAPLTVLTLFVLAFAPDGRRWPLVALASFAIATHLAHLVVACACVAAVAVAKPKAIARTVPPIAIAVSLLLGTNAGGHGRFGVSPFGSVFALARLTVDGPAKTWLEETCPAPDLTMCAWVGRMPDDTDTFLWDPNGPVWTHPGGPRGLASEASRIVRGTILADPLAVAWAAARNTAAQFFTVRLDATMGGRFLDDAIGDRLARFFPPAELARFQASLQHDGRLRGLAVRWGDAHAAALAFGGLATLILVWRAWRRDRVFFTLIATIGMGLLANAFATGALSGPTDRYQSRIAWLVLLPPLLAGVRWAWHIPARP